MKPFSQFSHFVKEAKIFFVRCGSLSLNFSLDFLFYYVRCAFMLLVNLKDVMYFIQLPCNNFDSASRCERIMILVNGITYWGNAGVLFWKEVYSLSVHKEIHNSYTIVISSKKSVIKIDEYFNWKKLHFEISWLKRLKDLK